MVSTVSLADSLKNPLIERSGGTGIWVSTLRCKRIERFCKILNWIEQFCRIRTKANKVTKIRLNRVQEILAGYVAWCWHLGFPCRLATPKSRQQGSSTFWECLEYALCELVPGYRAAIVAHHETGAAELFGKIETIKRGLRKSEWRPSDLSTDQGALLKWASESTLQAATIKTGDGLGMGGTLSAIHFSEVANFCDKGTNAEAAVGSILNSVAEGPLMLEIYESTAKGRDPFFHPLCERARDPESGSTIKLIFLPWFLEPGYSMTWEDYRTSLVSQGKTDPGVRYEPTEDELQLREKLASTVVQPHEVYVRWQTVLTDEQLIWRRWAIVNRSQNSLENFQRFYPSFYEECFTASATSMFSQETIEHYRATARPEIARGTMERGESYRFVSDPSGPVRIWAMPYPGALYVLGADVGGTTPRSDPSCAYVVHKATLEVVASIHGRLAWDDFTDLIYRLGYYYNRAEVVVENNFNPAVANTLHTRGYPNLYYYFAEATIDARFGHTPGFNTNKRTRPEILSRLTTVTRDKLAILNDPEVWKEMETFVWQPRPAAKNPEMDGDYRASGLNKDDRIMTLAIAYSRCPLQATEVPDVEPPRVVTSRAYEWFLNNQTKIMGPNNGFHL